MRSHFLIKNTSKLCCRHLNKGPRRPIKKKLEVSPGPRNPQPGNLLNQLSRDCCMAPQAQVPVEARPRCRVSSWWPNKVTSSSLGQFQLVLGVRVTAFQAILSPIHSDPLAAASSGCRRSPGIGAGSHGSLLVHCDCIAFKVVQLEGPRICLFLGHEFVETD